MEITIEEALINIRAVLDIYVGKKQEHLILDASYDKVINELANKTIEIKLNEEDKTIKK